MPSGYSPGIGLALLSVGSTGWGPINTENFTEIDAVACVGGLGTQVTEVPSASLNVKVAAGYFVNNSGILTSYAGVASVAMTAASSNYLWLNNSGVLSSSVTSFPASPTVYVPVATVAAGASTITSITDSRAAYTAVGAYLPSGTIADGTVTSVGITSGWQIGTSTNQILSLDASLTLFDGMNCALGNTLGTEIGTASSQKLKIGAATTIADGINMALGTTTGTQIGTASTQKLALYGKTPVVQSTFGSMFATSSWTTNEQGMLNSVWVALRAIGIGS